MALVAWRVTACPEHWAGIVTRLSRAASLSWLGARTWRATTAVWGGMAARRGAAAGDRVRNLLGGGDSTFEARARRRE
jgi:hypothetical protein